MVDIKARGTLRVLAVDGSPRFVAFDPSVAPGFDRELIEGFARLETLRVEWLRVPSLEALVPALVEGRGDVLAGGLLATPARMAHVDFTAEVFPTRLVVVTRRPHRVVRTIQELREEKVGTFSGSAMADALTTADITPARLYGRFAVADVLAELRSGTITACVLGVGDAVMAQRDEPLLQVGMFLGTPSKLAFGVRKDAPMLRQALDAYLANAHRGGIWNRLVVKYFGSSALDVLRRVREP
jgi:membrane-bound lytic murein transglycosylase F